MADIGPKRETIIVVPEPFPLPLVEPDYAPEREVEVETPDRELVPA